MSLPYRSLADLPLRDVLQLIRTLNVGPITFFHLIQRFGTAAAALEALPDLSLRGGRKHALVPYGREDVEKEIAAAEKFGARYVKYGEADYPKLLQYINDPPPVICLTGHAHLWHEKPLVAMVGSRNASANGCQLAQKLARELGEAGVVVVSGLARGIDSFAHKGALSSGTVGVIAGGIDNIYPPENAPLFEQMRASGAIITEQQFGSLPFAGSFPGRNRIIAGMSLATVVVEASPKSGSLITARFANENNRDVLAVPGSPLDPRSRGCNGLIKQGAQMVESVGDILQVISQSQLRIVSDSYQPSFDLPLHSVREDAATPEPSEKTRQTIIDKIGYSAVDIDTLVEQSFASAAEVQAVLLELELAGKLRRSAGNKVSLIGEQQSKA